MKTIDDVVKNAYVLTLPMITRFRGIVQREAVVFEGPHGWGEFSPFSDYSDRRSALWLESAIEAAYHGFTDMQRSKIPVNVTVPAVRAEDVPVILARYRISPHPTVKIKVAEGVTKNSSGADDVFREVLEQDLERVEAVVRYVAETVGTGLKFRVDPNGAWSCDQAVAAMEALAEIAVREHVIFEYAEQPVSSVRDMILLKGRLKGSGVLLAADESIRQDLIQEVCQDPETGEGQRGVTDRAAVRMGQAADVIIIKNAPLGGNRRALGLAQRIGLPVVVSSALDTGVGLYSGLRLAAAAERLNYACGLNTGVLFREDILPPAEVIDGVLDVPKQCPVPRRDKLRGYCADGARRKWWLERIRRVYSYLDGEREEA